MVREKRLMLRLEIPLEWVERLVKGEGALYFTLDVEERELCVAFLWEEETRYYVAVGKAPRLLWLGLVGGGVSGSLGLGQ